MFLGRHGINPSEPGPYIKFFDVFYEDPPVVGFHVYGAPDDAVAAFVVTEIGAIEWFEVFEAIDQEPLGPILFFSVGEEPDRGPVRFFNVAEELDYTPGEADGTLLFFNVADSPRCTEDLE